MVRTMINNSKTIPKLRFPEFTDDWQPNQLRHFLFYKNGKSYEDKIIHNGEYNLITLNSIDINGELQQTHKKIEQTDNSLSKGDLVMVLSDVAHGNFLGLTDILSNDNYVLNQRMGGLKPRGNADSRFLRMYINKNQKYFKLHGQGSSQLNLSKGDIEKFVVFSPTINEQRKIAGFLTAVVDKISMIEKKVNLLKKYKKSVIQKIFSQQIRFKDENSNTYQDWENKKLGDILNYVQPTKYIVKSTKYSNYNKTPVLTAGKTFILGYTDEDNDIFDDLPVIIFDDFTTASKFVDFPFKVKSSAMKILKAKKDVNTKIAYELLKRIRYKADNHQRHWISTFQDFYVRMPTKGEQQKITDFLIAQDSKIYLMEKELEQAKQFKKVLLQRMFI
jgi:type I restriction enzyme S subunit